MLIALAVRKSASPSVCIVPRRRKQGSAGEGRTRPVVDKGNVQLKVSSCQQSFSNVLEVCFFLFFVRGKRKEIGTAVCLGTCGKVENSHKTLHW